MSSKPRIIIVGDYNRSDFIFVAKQLHKEAKFYFLEYLNVKDLKNRECLNYGEVIYWKDFTDAYNLLETIKPSKVIFYFIESYNHVALSVACKVKHIPTFHLEHGFRFPLSYYKEIVRRYKEIENSKPKQISYFNRIKELAKISDLYDKYRNKLFFKRTLIKSPLSEKKFLKEFYRIRSSNIIFDTFQQLKPKLHLPNSYISFGPGTFNFHKEAENLPNDYPVNYIGIPQYDEFSKWKELSSFGEDILFIDQPFHEQQLFGWTRHHKVHFLKELEHRVALLNRKLFIKPHPLNDPELYHELSSMEKVQIVYDEWDKVVPNINTVLGFSSTLLLPFMAMSHISCFILDMHPLKSDVHFSLFLLSFGTCHAAISFEDLVMKLNEHSLWHTKQKEAKESFIKNYIYKFDGKSSERLRSILIDS